jgi:hypothetical protein
MTIEGFNFKEFAADLAQQAKAVLPADLSPQDKKYIVNIVNNFCYLAGEAIANDKTLNFDANQASIVTQFIGEWAFHKSIDLIKSKVDPQFRDSILQKIAFTVFEIAKQALLKKLPQAQMIGVVEHHVKKVYDESLSELMKKGALSNEQYDKAINQSNIDDMAKNENDAIANTSDTKILKLAAFAMLLKQMPNEKIGAILNKFSPTDAQVLIQYIQMEDLESRIDSSIVMKCLKEIKMTMPAPKKVNVNKTIAKFSKLVSTTDIDILEQLVIDERQLIQDFILNSEHTDNTKFSPWLLQLITKHVEDKVHDYKKEA